MTRIQQNHLDSAPSKAVNIMRLGCCIPSSSVFHSQLTGSHTDKSREERFDSFELIGETSTNGMIKLPQYREIRGFGPPVKTLELKLSSFSAFQTQFQEKRTL